MIIASTVLTVIALMTGQTDTSTTDRAQWALTVIAVDPPTDGRQFHVWLGFTNKSGVVRLLRRCQWSYSTPYGTIGRTVDGIGSCDESDRTSFGVVLSKETLWVPATISIGRQSKTGAKDPSNKGRPQLTRDSKIAVSVAIMHMTLLETTRTMAELEWKGAVEDALRAGRRLFSIGENESTLSR